MTALARDGGNDRRRRIIVLLPLAIDVLETVNQGLTEREITMLLGVLSCIQRNLQK